MDYNLDALSPRQFEHITQALLMKVLGPAVSVFGDGPDGGREATWEGKVPALSGTDEWDGYGVLQAKMRLHPQSPADNLKWLSGQVRDELSDWAKEGTNRVKKPTYLVFVTNVRLSPAADGGKDAILTFIAEKIQELSLDIKNLRVLEYSDLCRLLDDAPGIRNSYAALITPGDIVARILQEQEDTQEEFSLALHAHAARSLRDDTYLNLSQTGTVKDQQVTVAEVFVDLPLSERAQPIDFMTDATQAYGPRRRTKIVRTLIDRFDAASGAQDPHSTSHKQVVIIGGPGQGKSTATQFLAQMYRASFLEGSSVEEDPELAPALQPLRERLISLQIDKPRARRWPVRILLTDLADSLAEKRSNSLLEYIAQAVSYRSSVAVTTSQLRGWLKSYPWILMVDGLDEVPNSSNRNDVLSCIKDFFHDVKLLKADVAIVATTRPQGYDDEFNPDHYTHLNLASLPISVALSYAKGFISIRAGEGTSTATKIYDRLVKASKDETTARLFSSPLQVTILTVLIEKLGRVPQDRWRLFSQYYNVISQRELEKGGELSDLLQTYENDVEYLHRYIGNLLQARAAEAGETSSTLSREEFQNIISERLQSQGHDPNEVQRLSGEFLRLATHRLVFLALVQAGRVGFEIRSLQEYMSAWHIVSSPESEVIPAITAKALDPYWRNVVLFAIGSIFTSKDHLKGNVLNMCTEIDLSSPTTRLLKPGSVLALDILLDGSCHAQPAYSRPLGDRASRLIDGPLQVRVRDFAKFRDSELATILRTEVLKVTPASALTWANRAIALDAMCANDLASDTELQATISEASDFGVRAMLELVGSGAYRYLSDALASRAGEFSPSLLLEGYSPRPAFEEPIEEGRYPEWLSTLLQAIPHHGDGIGFSKTFEDESLSFSLYRLGTNSHAWAKLADSTFAHPAWAMMRAVGSFVRSPSQDSLAAALEKAAEAPAEDRILLQHAPWVISACSEASSAYLTYYSALTQSEVLRKFAALARKGELGDAKSWVAAEARWLDSSEQVTAKDFAYVDEECPEFHLPVSRSIGIRGASPFGSSLSVRRVHGTDVGQQFKEVLEFARMIPDTTCQLQLASLVNTTSFMATVILYDDESMVEKIKTAEMREIFTLLAQSVYRLKDDSPLWLGWLAAAPNEWGESEECSKTFKRLARMRTTGRLYFDLGENLEWVNKFRVTDSALWLKCLLMIAGGGDRIEEVPHETLKKISEISVESVQGTTVQSLCKILVCPPSDISDGSVDDVLYDLVTGSKVYGSVTLDMILEIFESQQLDRQEAILYRTTHLFSEGAPAMATKFIDVLS